MGSGPAADVMGQFESGVQRDVSGILADAATREEAKRQDRLAKAADLLGQRSEREVAQAELLGEWGGKSTIEGRQQTLDLIATMIAAMDPNLKLGTSGPARGLVEMLMGLTNLPEHTKFELLKTLGLDLRTID